MRAQRLSFDNIINGPWPKKILKIQKFPLIYKEYEIVVYIGKWGGGALMVPFYNEMNINLHFDKS